MNTPAVACFLYKRTYDAKGKDATLMTNFFPRTISFCVCVSVFIAHFSSLFVFFFFSKVICFNTRLNPMRLQNVSCVRFCVNKVLGDYAFFSCVGIGFPFRRFHDIQGAF